MRHLKNSRFALAAMLAMSACSIHAAGTATSDNPMGTSAPRAPEPVTYLVKEKSLIGNEMFEAGQTCLYAGLPSETLEPTCDIGRARAREYQESNKNRVAAMIDQNKDVAGGLDPQAFMANMMKVQAEMQAEQMEKQTMAIAGAVAQAVAATMAAMFPSGVPGSAPEAPAVEAPPAVTSTDTAGETKQAEGSGENGAPAKRTKG
jgi:hypothetical protein